jgi:hypothetical protein
MASATSTRGGGYTRFVVLCPQLTSSIKRVRFGESLRCIRGIMVSSAATLRPWSIINIVPGSARGRTTYAEGLGLNLGSSHGMQSLTSESNLLAIALHEVVAFLFLGRVHRTLG